MKHIFALLLAMVAVFAGATDWAAKMATYGLVDVTQLESSFILDIRYATVNNFVGKNMYGSFNKAYLHRDAAKALVAAQRALKAIDKNYSLIIYDAARPKSVQQTMWDMVKGTENANYVARPHRGGPHNYGVAVDVGLAYKGEAVDMGTGFDDFTTVAHITDEAALVAQGKMTKAAMKNRQILRRVMTSAGFKTYRREWWHFERYRIKYARQYCRLLDF